MRKIQAAPFLAFSLLSACSLLPSGEPEPAVCKPCASCPACPPTAVTTPVPPSPFARTFRAASWADLPGWKNDDIAAAWPAFMQSCRGMASKSHGPAWKRVCDLARAADGKPDFNPRAFFEQNLQPYAVLTGEGEFNGMITGYYEPLLRGSRTKVKGFEQPIRAVPDDLLTIDLSALFPELKDKRVRGRVEGNKVVPYWSRAEIGARGDRLPGKTLLYVDDAVELFFLQVQGSGRVKLTDGSTVRVNYADQNGHPYQSIGRVLVDRGELKLEEASMQGIQAWARANPARLDELLNANPSYVFFRENPNSKDGPAGALGVPLTPERSIAIDPRSVPLGAPVFLATTRPNSVQAMNRLVMAQDTGGAIKGAVRADFFWGFGKAAGEQAGRMKQTGRLWVLLPPEAAPR
ncbi:MltA domain-containing protein [Dechloromonas denitrificans]|uniref:murein transglycosylase A n=1 Tax=Dechloromonas denitrificans TaxID=281362 RepID=UPI001CF90908|nr:murein transglycosylase A [Dechloromonas denitrificans]UCV11239.1 MltA domain-containing protein [Dechloromonas denitrificans]